MLIQVVLGDVNWAETVFTTTALWQDSENKVYSTEIVYFSQQGGGVGCSGPNFGIDLY